MTNRKVVGRPGVSRLGIAGGLLAVATTGSYLAIMRSEGNDSFDEFGPWASMFALIGVAAVSASIGHSTRWRMLTLASASGASLALGLAALMTIGIVLIAAAVMLAAAARDATNRAERPRAAVVEVLTTIVVAFGATIAVVITVL